MLIHYCHWASQPEVRIRCLSWGGYACGDTEIPGVYSADFDDNLHTVYYTFEKEKVTCPDCIKER